MYNSQAQNLVPNPSFEEYMDCPADLNTHYKTPLPKHWITPTKGTVDYFNGCSKFNVGVPNNVMGNTFAGQGNAYVGLILLEKPEYKKFDWKKPLQYREYIQCRLIEPLSKDSGYIVSFMYCVAEYSNYLVNRIGAYLSVEKIGKSNRDPIELMPTIACDTNIATIIAGAWYEVADTIIAKGNETYLTIGNFYNDQATNYFIVDHSGVPSTRLERIYEDAFAYYYIDNVKVIQLKNINSFRSTNKISVSPMD